MINTSTAGLPIYPNCWSLFVNFVCIKAVKNQQIESIWGCLVNPGPFRATFSSSVQTRPDCTIIRVITRPNLKRIGCFENPKCSDLPPETMKIKRGSSAAISPFRPAVAVGCTQTPLPNFKLVSRKFQMFKFETT